ncbi:MAG TPA: DUF3891 family protein [Thermoleophilaceae bacterium]|nr:DUF3891 family protein [Thermoleophilaceae bacterium]
MLRREADAVLAIGQPSHAWLSGQLARAWGNEGFGALEPREEVCLAAEQHDAGMAAWDAAPTLNPDTGLPHSFIEMPVETHVELWSRAWELVLPQSRYAALLVSMHGTALYGMRDLSKLEERQADLVRDYLEGQRVVQRRLRESLDDPGSVDRNQRLIWTWDAFSLALCLDWSPHTLSAVPAAGDPVDVELTPAGPRRVRVHPWPFVGDGLRVRTEGRRLEGRFAGEDELHAALCEAPWVTLDFELVA